MLHEKSSISDDSSAKLLEDDDVRIIIPTELLYSIFDHVASSLPSDAYNPRIKPTHEVQSYTRGEVALKQCFASLGLVCRRWHALAEIYLNRVLAIQITFLENLAEAYTLDALLSWLDSTPSLPPLVYSLRLIGLQESPNMPYLGGFDPFKLRAVLARFPNLHVVDLVDVWFEVDKKVRLQDKQDYKETTDPSNSSESSPLMLDHFALYRTMRVPTRRAADTVPICLSWLGNVISIRLHARRIQPIYNREMNHLSQLSERYTCTRSLLLKARCIPHDLSGLSHKYPTGQACFLKNLYIQVDVSLPMTIREFIAPLAPNIEELCVDFSNCFPNIENYFPRDTMAAPLGNFESLRKFTLKIPLPSRHLLPDWLEILRNILRQFLPIRSLRSFALVAIDDGITAPTDLKNSDVFQMMWMKATSSLFMSVLRTVFDEPTVLPESLSLERFEIYVEDRFGMKMPFLEEQQDSFRKLFSNLNGELLLQF
ncbi:hypothetical protein BDY19DRAFT_997667 [Irpex rosettiformis]|uniref:Uncharacterized protein n=1 Tax=Irpex rosettiformis TaxID=378272 RepID=A0ACB8TQZ1_9APHY|nr:hypothetical protein BDY19DRAFT_997667 [Irpex rosettiformis]